MIYKFLTFFLCSLFLIYSSKKTLYGQQIVVNVTYINNIDVSVLSAIAGEELDYSVNMYKMVYNTVDVLGQPTIASGAVAIPANAPCTEYPIAIYEHGTSLIKSDVPSNNVDEAYVGRIFAAGGFFVLMPDYIGMGESPGLHPYCHGESEATATLDMIRAFREAVSLNLFPNVTNDNGEVFITGYSQGGHASMATHKYIEDNSLLSEFNVVASAPCSGPYEITGAMADTILSAAYSKPGYIVYLLASYQSAYGNLYSSYSDILKAPYDSIVVPYFDGNNFSYGMNSLNNQLPVFIDSMIVDTTYQNFINATSTFNHPLWQAMAQNDNHDWLPDRPIRMYYCTGDEQVSFNNALHAEEAMVANGADNIEAVFMGDGNHGNCVFPSLTSAFYWFDSLKTSCSANLEDLLKKEEVSVYPNPFSENITIDVSSPDVFTYQVLSSEGKTIIKGKAKASASVDLSQVKSGYYLLVLEKQGAVYRKPLMKE